MSDQNDKKIIRNVDDIPHGMLSSPQILFYLKNDLLISDYDRKCLGPATYHMRISGPVITQKDRTSLEYELCESDDSNAKKCKRIRLEPNSLTYVTTYEKFNLPKDVIARFNLKSKWVHKGLLLGTGPIVDPELAERLLIPLHNFSDEVVEIRNMDELISVEFTKTLSPREIYRFKGEDLGYPGNKSKDFNFNKYIERMGGQLPESSIASVLRRAQEEREEAQKQTRFVQNLSVGAGIVMMIALITLVVTTWSIVTDASNKVADAAAIVKKSDHIDYDLRGLATVNELKAVSDQVAVTSKLIKKLSSYAPYPPYPPYSNLKDLIEAMNKRINELESRVETLSVKKKVESLHDAKKQ